MQVVHKVSKHIEHAQEEDYAENEEFYIKNLKIMLELTFELKKYS